LRRGAAVGLAWREVFDEGVEQWRASPHLLV